MTTEAHINQLFNNLDQWRHLPAYQLERRADIFFSLYLAEVLANKPELGFTEQPILIPEFPCHYGSVYAGGNNQSFKVDYLAISVVDKKAYFVELKTDMASRNTDQDVHMREAQKVKLQKLLDGLKTIATASVQKNKYQCLLDSLRECGVCEPCDFEIEIVYVQPTARAHEISFSDFADVVEKHPDYLSLRFAKSLREWAKYEAGNPKPKDVNE
jgi:hypothetical protein